MKQYIIRLLFKVDASGLKKQLQSISKEAARVGAAMAKSMNRAFKTVAKQGGDASKQVVKSLDSIEKKAKVTSKSTKELGRGLAEALTAIGSARAIKGSIDAFARLESGLVKLQSAAQLFGKDFDVIKADLIEIRKEGTLSFETLNYVSRQLLTPAFGLASDQVGEFVKGLRNIAAVEGIYEDLDFALTSFVRGLQTGTAELLENLSPRIRAFIQTEAGGFAKVQKDQAARQKLFNEIFRASTELQAEYEKQLETTALTQKVFNQRLLELSETFGEILAPIYKGLLEVTSSLVEGINSLLSSLSPLGKSFLAAGVAAASFAAALKGLAAVLGLIGITIAPVAIAISAVVVGLAAFTISVNQNKTAIEQANERYEDQVKLLKKIKENDPTGKTLEYRNAVNKLSDATYELNKQLAQRLGLEEKLNDKTLRSDEDLLKFLQDEQVRLARDLKQEIEELRTAGFKGKFLGTDVGQGLAITGGEFATGPEVFLEALDFTFSAYSKASYGRVKELLEGLRDNTIAQKEVAGRIGEIADLPKGGTPSVTPPGGGGTVTGGILPRLGRGLSLTVSSREIEAQRNIRSRLSRIDAFRQNAKAMKELGESLKSTGVSAEEYIEKLKEEERVRYEISRLEDVSSSLGTLESAVESLGEGGLDAAKGLGKLSSALGQFLPGKLGGAFQLFGAQAGVLGSFVSLFQTIFPSGNDEYIAELKEQRKIQEAQENYLKTLVDLDIQRQKSERSALDRQIDAERLVATRQKEQLEATLTGDDLQKEQIRIDQETNDKVIQLLQQRLGDLGFTGELGTGSLADVSQRILQREQVGLIIQEFQSAERVRGADLTGFRRRVRETASPETLSILNRIESDFISRKRQGIPGILNAYLSDEQLLDKFAGRIFKDFIGEFSQTEDQTAILEEQYDVLKQIYDLETNQMGLTNDLLKEGNEIAKANLVAVQPRGFGAVDVSRGGLAFGRDFIPTAASLISNVGVPAQIGNLAVAAEANKTMDQKMLDSLQNQLIELKAQTNLLAQLTNTDARIVIANAQAAVKATGF